MLFTEGTLNEQVEDILTSRISDELSSETSQMQLGEVQVELSQEIIDQYGTDPKEIAQAILSELEKTGVMAQTPSYNGSSGILARASSTKVYTASVSSFLVQLGVTWIKQDFQATVSNGKVTSKKMLGSSYSTGVGLGAWNHVRSWFEQPSRSEFDVLYKGTISAFVKGASVAFPLTVKAIFDVRNSDLKQHFQ